jgi:hypothetical protein
VKTNDLLLLGLFGVGAYLIGRELLKQPSGAAADPGALGELPPPPGPEGAGAPMGDWMADAWDSLTFDVDVFPRGTTPSGMLPPSTAMGAVSSPTCDQIVVGIDWWDEAVADGVSKLRAGSENPALDVMAERLPYGCATADTFARTAFYAELDDRIRKANMYFLVPLAPGFQMPSQVPQGPNAGGLWEPVNPNPAPPMHRATRAPSMGMGDILSSLFTGVPRGVRRGVRGR